MCKPDVWYCLHACFIMFQLNVKPQSADQLVTAAAVISQHKFEIIWQQNYGSPLIWFQDKRTLLAKAEKGWYSIYKLSDCRHFIYSFHLWRKKTLCNILGDQTKLDLLQKLLTTTDIKLALVLMTVSIMNLDVLEPTASDHLYTNAL